MMQPGAHISSQSGRKLRLAYYVSHPIQYQAPLLRRIAQEPDIDLTALFGSDFSVRGYRDQGFGVEVSWDVPLLDGYNHRFLRPLRDTGGVSATTPLSWDILPALAQGRYDALWVHGYASLNSLQAVLAAKLLGIPVLLRAESWLGDRPRTRRTKLLKSLFLKLLGNTVDAVLPIGSLNALYWRHYLGPSVPQFTVPYAVDNAYFAARAEAAHATQPDLRRELGLDEGRRVILFASKLQQRKHADHLVAAYAGYIAGKHPADRPYLLIVGDGEERQRLEATCAQRGLDTVRFAGFRNQSELPRFFDLADVFVLPSRHEPWGLIVNEAMAAGCAVILSTDVGAHADLVTDGVEGCVYPVGDVGALGHALRRVLARPDTARQMGEAARRRIASWSFEQDVHGLRAALAHVTRKIGASPLSDR